MSLLAAAEDWRCEKDPFSVWTHQSLSIELRDNQTILALSRLNLLLRVDPERGLRACDALPFPGIMAGVFYWGYDVEQDRELIETLLAEAPSVFDDCGAWRPEHRVSALLVTTLVIDHAQRLHAALTSRSWRLKAPAAGPEAPVAAAEQALREVETTELPGWMRRAFGILLQRTDGRPIALGYLAHLVERTHGGRVAGPEKKGWSAFEQGLTSLCEALVAAGASTADVREAWMRHERVAKEKEEDAAARPTARRPSTRDRKARVGEGARRLHGHGLPYLWGAALMLGEDPRSPEDAGHIWAWFEELLEKRDPGLRLVEHGNANVEAAQRLGLVLSRAPRPSELFLHAYQRLEPQRRRAQHGSFYDYGADDLESMLLVRVGLHAALCWVAREAPPARSLFVEIYRIARRLWLTAPHSNFDETRKNLVTLCFAFMPGLFGDDLGAALTETIPAVADDARMLADACWFLWKNGVEPSRIVPLVREAGGDLLQAMRDAQQWSEIVAIEQRQQEFPLDLQQFAAALGLTVPVAAANPGLATKLESDLGDENAIPYFLWDDPMTVGELRRYLATASPPERDRMLGKILREARDPDVWRFTTPREITARFDTLSRHLGRRRGFWKFLLESWEREGLLVRKSA